MKRLLMAVLAAAALGACAKEAGEAASAAKPAKLAGDAAAGRDLFINKGCVLCHAINGVGGKAAPALDAADDYVEPDALEFAARMWRGAPAMVEFQSVELGYVIDLSGQDIANLASFAASRAEQKLLTEASIPEPMRGSLLDERFWEIEDWSEFMANGQNGAGDPEPPAEESQTPTPPNQP